MARKLTDLERQIEELTERWKRVLADYQNLEKRTKTEKEEFAQFANRELILKLLPALDSFENLEEHLGDEGLTLSLRQLRDVLGEEGLEKLETKGKGFNPEEMECVGIEAGEDNKVLKATRAGYRFKGKLLRPAAVIVGKKKID
ncbi:nucleotide exchange factor GrpE [Candidatus Shapirobacteria bacterium]|nr:nucleotide exchange factor GrpE [Candidatus Shapirobacteria bacterium]